jgi:hypothetical protein
MPGFLESTRPDRVDPGVGKTTLALQFLLAGARGDESCLYVTFSETGEELFKRLHPLQAVDAFVFVQINQMPHTRLLDRFMTRLSWVMTGGRLVVFLLLATLVERQRGWKATRAVVPALWLATATVEHPIKKWFRRRRRFVSLIEAIMWAANRAAILFHRATAPRHLLARCC